MSRLVATSIVLSCVLCAGCKEVDEKGNSRSRRIVRVQATRPSDGVAVGQACTVYDATAPGSVLANPLVAIAAHQGDDVRVEHRFRYVTRSGVAANDDAYWCDTSENPSETGWSVQLGRYPCLEGLSETTAHVVGVEDISTDGELSAGYAVVFNVQSSGILPLEFEPVCVGSAPGPTVDTAAWPLFSYSISVTSP